MGDGMPELGSKISLISKADIRYEGRLYTVDPQECTIALSSGKYLFVLFIKFCNLNLEGGMNFFLIYEKKMVSFILPLDRHSFLFLRDSAAEFFVFAFSSCWLLAFSFVLLFFFSLFQPTVLHIKNYFILPSEVAVSN